tara:strand:- start:67 stop:327 length:261 start_codon:yes stop_codon:yes gene_type:complete
MRYKYSPITIKKSDLIKKIITKNFGYSLTDDYYKILCNPNNKHINELVCEYTKNFFINNPTNNKNNLHRWSLNNRNKTKYESNYPW